MIRLDRNETVELKNKKINKDYFGNSNHFDSKTNTWYLIDDQKYVQKMKKGNNKNYDYSIVKTYDLREYIPIDDKIKKIRNFDYKGEDFLLVFTQNSEKLNIIKLLDDGTTELYIEIGDSETKIFTIMRNLEEKNSKDLYYLNSVDKSKVFRFDMEKKTSDVFYQSGINNLIYFTQLKEEEKLITCGIIECDLIDLTSKTKISDIKMKTTVAPGEIKKINGVFDYFSTFPGGKQLILISIYDITTSTNPVIELINISKITPADNIVISWPKLFYPTNLNGIFGTSFCVVKGNSDLIIIINPYEDKDLDTLEIKNEINLSEKNMIIHSFGLPYETGITYFHSLTGIKDLHSIESYLSFSRISICGGIGCEKCNSDLTDCQYCEEGIPKFLDPEHKDYFCLKTCPNSTLNKVSIPNERCINCLTEYNLDEEVCNKTFKFRIIESPLASRAEGYSTSIELAFPEVKNTSRLTEIFQDIRRINPYPDIPKSILNVIIIHLNQ